MTKSDVFLHSVLRMRTMQNHVHYIVQVKTKTETIFRIRKRLRGIRIPLNIRENPKSSDLVETSKINDKLTLFSKDCINSTIA